MDIQSLRSKVGELPAAQLAYRCAVAGRMRAERWGLALDESVRTRTRTEKPRSAGVGRILAYHSIGTDSWGVNDVRPADFEKHLQLAIDDGWTFATPAEVLADPARRQLAITFDDGATSVLDHAVPVLRHHGVPSTMFVVSGWADGGHSAGYEHVLDWDGLARLEQAGVTLASHSASHPDFGRLDPAAAERELVESRERLEKMLGHEIDEFAIPFGQSANWTPAAGEIAARVYRTVYAQAVDTRPAHTVPRTFITRIDRPLVFRAALNGAFDDWEEWFLGPR
ncbi:polysaccharide deacetylase family protein [Pseudonocardia oroxyli]|uniref:Peptidoglycan/xylan/chitin deacetylase, PgdA/CDA1 family n=1 Tax=Pseudonocardia oroxyli TaxID=366584 RepID=A0A1G7HP87_PSEOR|nr:polysaccharide deacetylase family protein [Pseudonocardia oroxyli]SDF02297.1 Peptidoglycan/xylan/chitin deacetylase, PgdA/CDA1 family [Pseudonocardia oroxyli]